MSRTVRSVWQPPLDEPDRPAPDGAPSRSPRFASAIEAPWRTAPTGACILPGMAVLVLLRDGVPLVRFALGDTATLGRASDCEVQLVDTELSRHHARLTRGRDGDGGGDHGGGDHGGWSIADLGSRNGTRVDGRVVEGAVGLRPGAVIELGTHRLLFDPPLDVVGDRDGDGRVVLVADDGAARAARPPDEHALSSDELVALHARALGLIATADRGGLGPALAAACAALGGERACLLALGPRGPRPLALHGAAAVTVSTTLLHRALAEGRALLVDDAQGDVSFAGAASVLAHALRAVLIVPLACDGAVVGALHVDHGVRGAFGAVTGARARALAPALGLIVARALAPPPAVAAPPPTAIGDDPRLRLAFATAARAAAAGASLLIQGESGTGKELIARAYHAASAHAAGPWIAVNCAAFSEALLDSELFGHEAGAFTGASRRHRGCFEQADGGTLFLDEVGELAPATQARLLRVLADRRFYRIGGEQPIEVDVRVVAATHRDLRARIAAGQFRDDLYWRLAVIPVDVPPLRERGTDRATLTAHFFAQLATAQQRRVPTLAPETQLLWDRYRWPGNVRELRNAVERLLVLCDGGVVGPDELPPELQATADRPAPGTLADAVVLLERERLTAAIAAHATKAAVARTLGISRPTLDKKLRDHNLAMRDGSER